MAEVPSPDGLRITRLSDHPAALGESPVWDGETGVLWWIDGVQGRILRTAPDTRVTDSWDIGGHIGAIALADSGLVVARDHDFLLFDPATGTVTLLHHLEGADPAMRLNTRISSTDMPVVSGVRGSQRPV